jgi:hypothetical protein
MLKAALGVNPRGSIVAYERKVGTRLWTPVLESENVILDGWYNDFFAQVANSPLDRPGGMDLGFMNLALGYQDSPTFDRTDLGLAFEWSNVFTKLTMATGTSPITTLHVQPSPIEVASGDTITLGTQNLTTTSAVAIGDTTIAVASFTPSINYPIGRAVVYNAPLIYVPQRLPFSVGIPDISDPPSVVMSYFLPAAANSKPIRFTEAALVYNTNSFFASHVAFAYTKDSNTDLRIDYLISRESDE